MFVRIACITALCAALPLMAGKPCCPHGKAAAGQQIEQCEKGEKGKKLQSEKWKDLNLTEEQQAQLKALREADRPARKAHAEKARALRDSVRLELAKENPDKAILDGYSARIGQLHAEMATAMNEHLLAMKGILTPEQFTKFIERDNCPMGGPMGKHGACMKPDSCRDKKCAHKGEKPAGKK